MMDIIVIVKTDDTLSIMRVYEGTPENSLASWMEANSGKYKEHHTVSESSLPSDWENLNNWRWIAGTVVSN